MTSSWWWHPGERSLVVPYGYGEWVCWLCGSEVTGFHHQRSGARLGSETPTSFKFRMCVMSADRLWWFLLLPAQMWRELNGNTCSTQAPWASAWTSSTSRVLSEGLGKGRPAERSSLPPAPPGWRRNMDPSSSPAYITRLLCSCGGKTKRTDMGVENHKERKVGEWIRGGGNWTCWWGKVKKLAQWSGTEGKEHVKYSAAWEDGCQRDKSRLMTRSSAVGARCECEVYKSVTYNLMICVFNMLTC